MCQDYCTRNSSKGKKKEDLVCKSTPEALELSQDPLLGTPIDSQFDFLKVIKLELKLLKN